MPLRVSPFEGATFVPETELSLYLNPRKQRKARPTAVLGRNGRQIGQYPLYVLNQMYGKRWFWGGVRNNRLCFLVLRVSKAAFRYELERITGERQLTHSELRRQVEPLLYKTCAHCGKRKDRDEFLDAPILRCDFLGQGHKCRDCTRAERLRAAASDSGLRRAREAYAPGEHSNEEWNALLQRLGRRCLRCDAEDDITKDHIVPLSRGGTNDIENLQPLCRSCNSWKNDRTVDFRDHFSA